MGASTRDDSNLQTACLLILAAVAITAALIFTRPVMIPFVLALLATWLVAPLVDTLERRLRTPRSVSIVAALVVVGALLFLLQILITTSVSGLLANVDVYRARLSDLLAQGTGLLDRLGIDIGQASLVEAVQQLPLVSLVRGAVGTMVDFIANGTLVLIFVIYLLSGRATNRPKSGLYAEIDAKVRRYIATKVSTSAVTGVLVGVILWLFGLDLALVFGVLAFLLNFIPSVGSMIATLLPLPVALIQLESTGAVVACVALPGVVQFAIGNVIEPKLMGQGLDLHPVTVLLALIFWGLVWGIAGMLLATPITAVLRIILGRIEATRPIGELLAGHLPGVTTDHDPPPEAHA